MTTRQSIAAVFALTLIGAASLQVYPAIADALSPAPRAPMMLTAEVLGEPALTGHAEIDDLPAYMTDGVDGADH